MVRVLFISVLEPYMLKTYLRNTIAPAEIILLTSGTHFVDFWSQGLKMLKSILLEIILSPSGVSRKSPNRAFWSSFCRLLEPRPENCQIDPSGAHLVDFWDQGLKIVKSTLLELILSTSGAKA